MFHEDVVVYRSLNALPQTARGVSLSASDTNAELLALLAQALCRIFVGGKALANRFQPVLLPQLLAASDYMPQGPLSIQRGTAAVPQ